MRDFKMYKAETRKAVRNAFRRGATQIKLFTGGGVTSSYDPLHSGPQADEIRAAVEVAETWDTYVLTHSFNEDAIRTLKSLRDG